jgi:hypothetical protein
MRAEAQESNKAAAEALFKEGRSLMSEHRYEEAIQKLKASQDLDPGLGTLLNLADCYEKLGRTASAWAEYREIAALARRAGASERESLAEQKIQALEPQLSNLAIQVSPNAGDPNSLEITRDGQPLRRGEVGVAIPVDPGEHVVRASAPGKQPWSMKVVVGPKGDSQTVVVPVLSDTSPAASSASPVTATDGSSDPGMDRGLGDSGSDGSGRRTLGLVLGGLGLAGVAVGSFVGLKAFSTWSDAKDACNDYPFDCGREGKRLEADARGYSTISTWSFVAGGALLAAGSVLFITASPGPDPEVSLGLGPSSVAVKGRF